MNKLDKIVKTCIDEATLSKATKRKVGAVIVLAETGEIIGKGHNYATDGGPCEVNGVTRSQVMHAEIAAITNAKKNYGIDVFKFNKYPKYDMYVTHQPCRDCMLAIENVGINNVVIIDDFLKFDNNKIRYDLIPPEVNKALAEVLTYGAKKYKPNNWKKCSDIEKYIAALLRHLEAHRAGEMLDKDSGLLHIAHALTNAAFVTYFITNKESINEKNNNKT
jgi:deoxycytidylate deaminase